MNKTSMLYWYPKIQSVVPTPETRFLDMPAEIQSRFFEFFDGEDLTEDDLVSAFVHQLGALGAQVGYPLFLRTALTSAKHYWRRTCHVETRKSLLEHVVQIIEFSECASMPGLDWSDWAVRELLPTRPAFHAFNGMMPIVCEFRVFVRDGEEICWHPYWPAEAIEGHTEEKNWRSKLRGLQNEPNGEARELAWQASMAVPEDAWSVDVLKTDRGWYVTDMALAAESYHWPGCDIDVGVSR